MLNITDLKKKYKKSNKQVSDYMNNLIDTLSKDYGDGIDPSWEASLDLMSDWYLIYCNAIEEIKENGPVVKSPSGVSKVNPAFNVANTATRILNDILKTFAATPVAKSKMKALGKNVTPINDAMLLESLVS